MYRIYLYMPPFDHLSLIVSVRNLLKIEHPNVDLVPLYLFVFCRWIYSIKLYNAVFFRSMCFCFYNNWSAMNFWTILVTSFLLKNKIFSQIQKKEVGGGERQNHTVPIQAPQLSRKGASSWAKTVLKCCWIDILLYGDVK